MLMDVVVLLTRLPKKRGGRYPFKPLISKFKVFIVAPKHLSLMWRGPGLDLVPQTLKSGLWTRNFGN